MANFVPGPKVQNGSKSMSLAFQGWGYLVVETNPPSTTAASATLDVLNKRVLFIGINSLLTTILVVVAVVFSANGGGGGGTTSIESLGSVAASTSSEECVTSVCAVAVGAGGSGGMAGGGGGGLGWRNDIQVVPGQSYTVHVGLGAQSADYNHVVIGRGGSFIGTGGGNGGNGGSAHSESGGGGGAGGYSGNGGDGGKGTASASGDGGGVGIYGQGASGAGGIEGCTNSYWPGNAEDGKPGQGGGGGGGGGGNSCGGSNGGHGSSTTATTVGSGSGRFYDTNKAGDGARTVDSTTVDPNGVKASLKAKRDALYASRTCSISNDTATCNTCLRAVELQAAANLSKRATLSARKSCPRSRQMLELFHGDAAAQTPEPTN
eukprot:gene8125-629_t